MIFRFHADGCLSFLLADSHTHTVTTVNTIMPDEPLSTYGVQKKKKADMGLETRITIMLSTYVGVFLLPSKSRQPILFLMRNAFV